MHNEPCDSCVFTYGKPYNILISGGGTETTRKGVVNVKFRYFKCLSKEDQIKVFKSIKKSG